MKLATMLGVVVVGAASFSNPATAAPDWLSAGQSGHAFGVSNVRSSFVPTYVKAGDELVQTDIEPAFHADAEPIDRLTLAKNEMLSYASLTEDWDGNGGTPPEASDIRDAIAFLDLLPGGIAIPTPMVSSSGEVGLYWDLPSLYADIAFEGAGALSLFVRHKETREEQFVTVDDLRTVSHGWFMQMLGRQENA